MGAHTRMGSAFPFTVTGGSAVQRNWVSVARYVDSPTTIESGAAVDCRRDAVFTMSPVTRSPTRGP